MPPLQIAALSDQHREACARLLAGRYERQRAAEPLLPDVDDVAAEVPPEGVVATRGGDVVAYVAGAVEEDTAKVGFGGCAASEPEAIRDCYAALAAGWGVTRFSVAVPAADLELRDPWFRLAFGCQFLWAVRETEPAEPVDFGGTIRASTPEDLDATAGFDRILWELQMRSPSFSGREPWDEAALRDEWRDLWTDPTTFAHFLAERDGRAVGHVFLYRRPPGELRVPEANIDLAHAVTVEHARGSGVGLALTAHALRHAHEQGFRSMTVDWRSVNLFSSRFWPRRGFRAQYLRLYRAVP